MTWHIWMVTYLRRNVTIVCGATYHLLGSRISWDLKIQFWLQVESHISDWQFSKLRHLVRYVFCHNAMAYDSLMSRQEIHICESSCRLLATKGISQLDQNNGHGKFGQLQRQIVSPNSGYKHCKNTLEQRHKQQKSKIHVHGYQEFLPDGDNRVFRVYENPLCVISKLDSWAVRPCQTPKGWLGIPGNETSSVGDTTGRNFGNKRLRRKLVPFGYYKCIKTPGLWKHETRPLTFSLVADDFGVKYESKDDVDHLIASIKSTYKVTKDWTGNLYCSISLNWD